MAKGRVLHDIELEFPRRHTVAVVGESGSGKSTLARVIAGILPPTSGRVALNGTELAGSFRQRSARELRRIQLVHQSPDTALNPRHTVREILGRPLALSIAFGAACSSSAFSSFSTWSG